jgi:hypothetical protein
MHIWINEKKKSSNKGKPMTTGFTAEVY